MPDQPTADKAILVAISDDGDPFEIGDYCTCPAYMTQGMMPGTGESCLCIIRAINGDQATCECLDTNLQPMGMFCNCGLAQLREYILPGTPEAADGGGTITVPNGIDGTVTISNDASLKAVPDDAPKEDFAYTPDDSRSNWGLYVGDAVHTSLAAAAL